MLKTPTRRPRLRRGRVVGAVVVALGLIVALFAVPVPYRIAAPAWIEPEAAEPVYVSVAGTLHDAAAEQAIVEQGQAIATLVNHDVALQVAELTAEVARRQARLKTLRLMQADDKSIVPLIPAEVKALEDTQHRLEQWRRDQEGLVLRAPIAGTILAPPRAATAGEDGLRLAGWQGTPLERRNRGCHLETGELVCLVGDPSQLEATLIIDQAAVAFVRPGQQVRVRIDQAPPMVITGTITELAKASAEDVPPALAQALDLPMSQSNNGGGKTAEAYYQARVSLPPNAAPLLVGMHGQAKILADWQPLGMRFVRYLQRTFRA